MMLSRGVRRVLLRLSSTRELRIAPLAQIRERCDASSNQDLDQDQFMTLMQLFVERHYISPGQTNMEFVRRGMNCDYGPLGLELRRNVLDQWWRSVTGSRVQVFGINTRSSSQDTAEGGWGHLRIVENLKELLEHEELSKEQLIQKARLLLQRSLSVRSNLLQGALEQFVPSFELVNRKLPFGLAETGLCFQPSDGSGCPAEVNQASLVWFCLPRTSPQWLDHWTRQRLKWWRKFALSPSEFSSSDVPEVELEPATTRGVKIVYHFPWGQEPVESLWIRGDAELLCARKGVYSKLKKGRDGRKSVPHVVSVTGNIDRGLMAFLFNSLQLLKREDIKLKLQHRKVLKLHPVLAPVKVALAIGKGATNELRQICEGLLQEFTEAEISTWPGYLETAQTSMERVNAKYDEMGVLFTVVISESTLEKGLLQVRSRDTTIKETMHISEIKNFLCKYISSTDNI